MLFQRNIQYIPPVTEKSVWTKEQDQKPKVQGPNSVLQLTVWILCIFFCRSGLLLSREQYEFQRDHQPGVSCICGPLFFWSAAQRKYSALAWYCSNIGVYDPVLPSKSNCMHHQTWCYDSCPSHEIPEKERNDKIYECWEIKLHLLYDLYDNCGFAIEWNLCCLELNTHVFVLPAELVHGPHSASHLLCITGNILEVCFLIGSFMKPNCSP